MKKQKSKREFSAGGVVYKRGKQGVKWLVCKHSGYHKWVFPKGLVEEGEKARETAVREVEEECGIKTRIVGKMAEPEKYIYTFEGTKIFKVVEYFLMEYVSGDIKDHDFEMEEVEWLEFKAARERLDFSGAKKVLDKAKKLLEEKEKQLRLV
jgi:8-oxo-dGTP pyrophosphatase MutT (NUDIX family)